VVAGYNVYRGTTLGAYSRINPTLDSGTAYADSTVVSGHTYYYAATAVDSAGVEGVYSTPVEATIP
jgi:fibronectin type 3 domain-containing protein